MSNVSSPLIKIGTNHGKRSLNHSVKVFLELYNEICNINQNFWAKEGKEGYTLTFSLFLSGTPFTVLIMKNWGFTFFIQDLSSQ